MFKRGFLHEIIFFFLEIIRQGSGWWTINVLDGGGKYDYDGSRCDHYGTAESLRCDWYIRILIEQKKVFQSDTLWGELRPQFFKTFRSDKILKSARIEFQLWDDDSGSLGSEDELILTESGNVEYFLNKKAFRHRTTFVNAISFWEDEYELKRVK